MDRYIIEKKDPGAFKETIIEFWNEYLPGTPEQRYEWLDGDNPCGKNIWFFAFDAKTNELAGFMSVMPRQYYHNGRPMLAGIMGDFIVAGKFRGTGLGKMLAESVVSDCLREGFDVMYILPNPNAKKALSGSVLKQEMVIRHLVLPVRSRQYLNSGVKSHFAPLIAPVLDAAFMLALNIRSFNVGGAVEEVFPDNEFDTFWNRLKVHSSSLTGIRSLAYLKWRYLDNPEFRFRILALRKQNELQGYLVFTINRDKADIFDIAGVNPADAYPLLKGFYSVCRKENCKSAYIRINAENPLYAMLKKCLFLDGHDDYSLLYKVSDRLSLGCWPFLSNDRNI